MTTVARGRNPNHPKKGSIITVEPIRHEKDIQAIKDLLADNPRDLALFTIGINTNLRSIDLVSLRARTVFGLESDNNQRMVRERKTNKIKRFSFNQACRDVVQRLLDAESFAAEDFLFRSKRTHRDKRTGLLVNHITPIYLNNLVKKWTASIGLQGNYGAHTLRKTWGYHQRTRFGLNIPTLMTCFNHSSQRQTLAYLGVTDEEVQNAYDNIL